MKRIARHSMICAALLTACHTPVPSASSGQPPQLDVGLARPLVGRWQVQFANGVKEVCRIGTNGKALVSEPHRTAVGRMEVRGASEVISYDDDRAERWTPVGERCVVEHWFPIPPALKRMPGSAGSPGLGFSHPAPVLGIADRVSDTERFEWPDATCDDTDVWIQSYFRFNGLPTNSVLRLGMNLDEFVTVLGEPTQRYRTKDGQIVTPEYQGQADDWVEWHHNPKGMHVAPFIRARVENGVVKELHAGRA